MTHTRRQALAAGGAATLLPTLFSLLNANERDDGETTHIATNTYPWLTFTRRANQEFQPHSDDLLGDIANTGIRGYEPIVESAGELDNLDERLNRHGLEMRSIYVNSVLHDPTKIDNSIASVIEIAKAAKRLGTRIVVTNPSPVRWGGLEDKSDAQLRRQAESLDRLALRCVRLAWRLPITTMMRNCDRAAASSTMLTATDPENVKFCLELRTGSFAAAATRRLPCSMRPLTTTTASWSFICVSPRQVSGRKHLPCRVTSITAGCSPFSRIERYRLTSCWSRRSKRRRPTNFPLSTRIAGAAAT